MQKAFLLLSLIGASPVSASESGDFLESLSGSAKSGSGAPSVRPAAKASWVSGLEFTTDADFLLSDDIDIQRYSARLEREHGATTLGLTYTYTRYDVDYSPSTLGFETELDEETDQLSFDVSHRWNGSFTSDFSLSGYQGFTDFRSIWTSEFFRQSFRFFPEYEAPDPEGFSVSLGTTYTLPNGIDSITVDAGYSRDTIAPGFEVGEFTGILESSNDTLNTYTLGVTGNFYITNKITSQWFTRVAFVTDRDVRTQLRANFAWSLHDQLTLRGEIGAAFESPDFDSFFGGLSLNYQITPNLEASAGYRLYEDSGEITTSNFNTSAPSVNTKEAFVSLLYNRGSHSLRASVAIFDTDFDSVTAANIPFENLFQDRDFIALRTAYSYRF